MLTQFFLDNPVLCLTAIFVLVIVFLVIRLLSQWQHDEKEHDKKVADEYKKSELLKQRREKFLKDLENKRKK